MAAPAPAPAPMRIFAFAGNRGMSVATGQIHCLAAMEDSEVYNWGMIVSVNVDIRFAVFRR